MTPRQNRLNALAERLLKLTDEDLRDITFVAEIILRERAELNEERSAA